MIKMMRQPVNVSRANAIRQCVGIGVFDFVCVLVAAGLAAFDEVWATFGALGVCVVALVVSVLVARAMIYAQRAEQIEQVRHATREQAGLRMIEARMAETAMHTLAQPRQVQAPLPRPASVRRVYMNGVLISGDGPERLGDVRLDPPA